MGLSHRLCLYKPSYFLHVQGMHSLIISIGVCNNYINEGMIVSCSLKLNINLTWKFCFAPLIVLVHTNIVCLSVCLSVCLYLRERDILTFKNVYKCCLAYCSITCLPFIMSTVMENIKCVLKTDIHINTTCT